MCLVATNSKSIGVGEGEDICYLCNGLNKGSTKDDGKMYVLY
jgi:hypothetical protein